MKKTLLLLVALITATIAFAKTEINGIYYNLNNSTQTAEVTSGSNDYSGNITIPEKVTYNSTEYSVTSIGNYAFQHCSSLTSITIPNSVTSIGSQAFQYCSSLTSITIPNSVTSIGNEAFWNCSSLTSITIPNSITFIGNGAFYDCSSLTSISIPNSVTSIGEEAFFACLSLTSISIPNSVTSIGEMAFFYCSSLTSIEVDANNPNYASIDGVLYNKDVTTLICCPCGKTSITIPNSVTSIGERAFFDCSSLTSITIPNSVTSIGEMAFFYCSSLTSIEVDANNQNYASIDGVLYNKDVTTLICCPGGKTSITIPNSVTSIGERAFFDCSSLTSISISNSVTSIRDYAFDGCKSLKSITIPNSVTSIGNEAFYGCKSLKSIIIPNSVTSIGRYAFSNCLSLNTITCLGSTPPKASDLGAEAENLILKVPSEAYNDYLQHAYWGQFLDEELLIKTNPAIINKGYNGEIIILYNPFAGNKRMIDATECYAHTGLITMESSSSSHWFYPSAWRGGEDKYKMTKEGDFWKLVIPNIYEYYECPESEEILKLAFVFNDGPNGNKEGKTVDGGDIFINLIESTIEQYEIIVTSNGNGNVIGGGFYNENEEAILTATPNDGYRFAQWTDGNTDNPRTIIVTQDSTFTAEFALEEFALYVTSASPELGYVKHTIEAIAIEGFEFDRWSDDNTDNPRTIILTEDTKLYAYFRMATGGNPVDLETAKISSANIYTTNGTLHIEGATENYHILDAAGRLIYSGNASTLTLPRGIYLVTINGEVEKIVL